MPCQVVNSQAQTQARLPSLPQQLPSTQSGWLAFLQALNAWGQILQQESHSPNVLPPQFQTFAANAAIPVLGALAAVNCTPTVDATTQYYGGASLKVVIAAAGATLTFAGTPISIAPASRWFAAFEILASAGCTGSLTVKTATATITEDFVVSAAAGWQQVWGLFDLRACADTQATWEITFSSTATVWLDGLQMNLVGSPISKLPKFAGTQMVAGSLAYADSVDLATNEVLNKTANNITYTAGGTVDSLMPAEAAADVTSTHTSNDTANVNAVAAATISQGAGRANAAIDSTNIVVAGGLDLSRAYTNKTLTNIPDGAARFAVVNAAGMNGASAVDTGNNPRIDFSQAFHLNKNTDSIAPGNGAGALTQVTVGTLRNLVPDSSLRNVNLYWGGGNSIAAILINQNMDGTNNCFEYVGTGAASGDNWRQSLPIAVNPGQTYTLSAVVNGANVTSGSACVGVYSTGVLTQYGVINITAADINERLSTQIVIPAGVTEVVVIFDTGNCTVSSGAGLYAEQIQLEPGAVMTAYKETTGDQLQGSLLIDFGNSAHLNKNLTSIADGAARFAVVNGAGLNAINAVDASNRVATASGAVSPLGSIVTGSVANTVSYTSTTTSVTIAWTGGTINRMDGTQTTIPANATGVAVTGLTASTSYYAAMYWDEVANDVAFVTGEAGAVGTPAILYPSESMVVGWQLNLQSRLNLGWIPVATPASGSGGGNGSQGCCLRGSQLIELESGIVREAQELTTGDALSSPLGATRITQLRMEPWQEWYRVTFSDGRALEVAADHRFLDPSGVQVHARDLTLQTVVRGRGCYLSVVGLQLLTQTDLKVSIEVQDPHVYYVDGVLSHNKALC